MGRDDEVVAVLRVRAPDGPGARYGGGVPAAGVAGPPAARPAR